MKLFLIFCGGLLLLSMANLPIGYYTFLRIVVTIGSVAVVLSELRNGFNFWLFSFGVVGIIFNPIFPVYLNDKGSWLIIDIICAIIFIIRGLTIKNK